MMSKNEEIIGKNNKCLDYAGGNQYLGIKNQVHLLECHSEGGNQRWTMKDDRIRHNSGYCLELLENDPSGLVLNECDQSNEWQKWIWKKKEKVSKKLSFMDLI